MSRPAHQLSSNGGTKARTQESVAMMARHLRCAAPIKHIRRPLQRAIAQRFSALALEEPSLQCSITTSRRRHQAMLAWKKADRNRKFTPGQWMEQLKHGIGARHLHDYSDF